MKEKRIDLVIAFWILIILLIFITVKDIQAKENPYFKLEKRIAYLYLWELNDDFEIKKVPIEIYDGTPEEILESTIRRMLKGPQCKGLYSFFPEGTRLKNLEIRDGILYLDFTEELQNYGGGSYNVLHIRQQLEETIFQFSGVRGYRVTAGGKTEEEGVLQP
jgi:spore germination protein GerM